MMRTFLSRTICVTIAIVGSLSASGVLQAGYAVLDGLPVTQGQMRIAETDFERVRKDYEGSTPAGTPNSAPADRLTLKETIVDADVAGVLARVRVRQVFENPYSDRLEAFYVFPLPENAAVDRYSFQIGERVIRGVVKKREVARQIYQQARDNGQAAALLEQERANIFSQSVANIPASGTVTVTIEYVQPIQIDGDYYVFRFPMVVGPRFIPGNSTQAPNTGRGAARDTDEVPDASRITPVAMAAGMRNGNDVTINVTIEGGMPIHEVTGITHSINVQKTSETSRVVSLINQTTIADRDFVVNYRLSGDNTVLASLTHRSADDGYFALMLQPEWHIEEAELAPREVILLLDVSGSMKGASISQLRIFADRVLGELHPQDTLRVVSFSNSISEFRPSPVSASPDNVDAARQFVRSLRAGGGTNLLPALRTVLQDEGDESAGSRYLFLLTDALVGNDNSILGYLRDPQVSDVRVFPVCFGAAPNHYLISRAADIGRGFAMQVTNQDNAAEVAARFNEKTSAPYLTDIVIDWGSLKVRDVIPNRIPDLYAGRPLVVTGRFDVPGSGNIRLTGNVQAQSVALSMVLDLPENEPKHDSLGTVWARQRIREIWNANVGKETPQSIDEITRLGLQHQLMTQYTSFVAVDEDQPEVLAGNLQEQSVQVLPPEGTLATNVQPGKQVAQPVTRTSRAVVTAPSVVPQQHSSPPAPVNVQESRRQSSGGSGSSSGGGGAVEWVFLAGLGLLGAGRCRSRRRKAKADEQECHKEA
ncbi:MAG: VIT domain-containing protein [Planctomycetota bacterium]|nr:VIT domain-containing protein [Planctomycetota bacterium]MDA1163933.1 VIT domain-containing protein [Planctomycetota bacterium]